MNTKTGIEKGLFKKIKNLSVIKNLVNTITIDDTIEEISISYRKKLKGIETNWKESFKPKLKKRNLIYKNSNDGKIIITDEVNSKTILFDRAVCECVSERINREFSLEIFNFCGEEIIKWKYFNRNFLSRLFLPKQRKDLIKKILEIGVNFDWIIISPRVLKSIENSNYFFKLEPAFNSTISNNGYLKIDNLRMDVFVSPDLEKEKIWFGNYKSITLILKDKLDIKKIASQSFSIGIDYQFIKTGDILLLNL
jgi:hypothetical protein